MICFEVMHSKQAASVAQCATYSLSCARTFSVVLAIPLMSVVRRRSSWSWIRVRYCGTPQQIHNLDRIVAVTLVCNMFVLEMMVYFAASMSHASAADS